MGQAGSIPAEFLQARAPGDRVIQQLSLQFTAKYTYKNSGYSLVQQDKRGALIIGSTSIMVFKSYKHLMDIKLDDPRWKTGELEGEYEPHNLCFHFNISSFRDELGPVLKQEPESYEDGVMTLRVDVVLTKPFVDHIFNRPS